MEQATDWQLLSYTFTALMSLVDFQRKVLGDRVRNHAFEAALRRVIRKGKTTIADIGAGTGFLSFLASQLGAKECHLFEHSGALRIAEKIARANRIRNCHFFEEHTSQVIDPPKVDLVVSETLGNFGIDEHIIENMEDAKRMLKRSGTLIPQQLSLFIAPIVCENVLREINVWDHVGFDIDFAPMKDIAFNNIYVQAVRPSDLFPSNDAAKCWDTIDFRKRNQSIRRGEVSWNVPRAVAIYGFAAWWEAELVPGVTLSTSPFKPKTHWEQIVLPLLSPLRAQKGDSMRLQLIADTCYSVGLQVQWETLLQRKGKTLQKIAMDMRRGELSGNED